LLVTQIFSFFAKGVIKGREEGREEGRAEGRADAAKRMVASGMTKEQVAAILQLSANELDTLFGS
jgi:predicted transposase/invertase (TIGR01784 family)